MWCSAVGCLVTLTLSLLAAPLASVAQPRGPSAGSAIVGCAPR